MRNIIGIQGGVISESLSEESSFVRGRDACCTIRTSIYWMERENNNVFESLRLLGQMPERRR